MFRYNHHSTIPDDYANQVVYCHEFHNRSFPEMFFGRKFTVNLNIATRDGFLELHENPFNIHGWSIYSSSEADRRAVEVITCGLKHVLLELSNVIRIEIKEKYVNCVGPIADSVSNYEEVCEEAQLITEELRRLRW